MGMELTEREQAVGVELEDVDYITDYDVDEHVRIALKSVAEGDTHSYEELVGVMHQRERNNPDDVALLVASLNALRGAVTYVNIVHHRSLLSSICTMSLWNYGPDVMQALVDLVVSLAISNGEHVDLCLNMLISNFKPKGRDDLMKSHILARKEEVLGRVHDALRVICGILPLSPLRLEQIVRDRVPNKYDSEPVIVVYVENMLRLESSSLGRLVGSSMLLELMNRLIDLDVDIEWNDILQEDPNKGIFELELDDMEQLPDEEFDTDESFREFSSRKVPLSDVAKKLDSLMLLTFEHLRSCHEGGRLVEVFETLLQSFQSTILNAYKSKFAQFVMFYACSLDPDNCGVMFVNRLLEIFESSIYPQEWRMSSVAYLASYLSRAKFLTPSDVAPVLGSLVDWCSKYCEQKGGEFNPRAHKVFYATCQAIMYLLCFRMKSMLSDRHLKSLLFGMPIEEILKHPLDPLKVCLPSVVEEFLRQAKAARLFCFSGNFVFSDMLESESSMAFGGVERLDIFFPFDPYLLKKSDRYIRPNFIHWSAVRPIYDDDVNNSSSDEDIDEEVVEERVMPMSFDEDDIDHDEFDVSLNQMSITPRDTPSHKFGGKSHGFAKMPSRIRPSTSPESL